MQPMKQIRYITVGEIQSDEDVNKLAALLAPGYVRARGKWYDGQPTAERIAEFIGGLQKAMDLSGKAFASSGGLRLHRYKRGLVLKADRKLAPAQGSHAGSNLQEGDV